VKGKTGTGFGDPLEMVDAEKVRRLRRAAEVWLARNPSCAGLDYRFEVVAVRPGELERITV
jgi:Holliday junction resolvase-like predicted endonuclease